MSFKQETTFKEPSYNLPYVEQSSLRKPRDYLIWSILNLLFGNLIFGLIALFYSIKTRNKVRDQMLGEAQITSKRALIFNIIATITMIFAYILIIVLSVVLRRRKN
jgi:hypothetical protein